MEKMFKAIAAMATNRVIGKEGKLPWSLPEELAWFKEKTLGHTIIMGRKTFESIGKRALPGRLNMVVSREWTQKDLPLGVLHLPSLELIEQFETQGDLFIIGGSQLYESTLPICSDLYLTHIKANVSGDAYFPAFESYFDEGTLIKETKDFRILHYKKIKAI